MLSDFSLIYHIVKYYTHRQGAQLCVVKKGGKKRKMLKAIIIKIFEPGVYCTFMDFNFIFLLDYIIDLTLFY